MNADQDAKPDSDLNQQLARNFIEKIERDRDRMLETIANETRAEVSQIYEQAYRSAREFHRVSSEQTRNLCDREADRHLARVFARLRRESWRALRRLQTTALAVIQARMNTMYADPDRQWAWCRHWLQAALNEAGDQALSIVLGRGLKTEVKSRLEDSLRGHAGSWTVTADETIGCGITIAWGDELIDGRLEAQQPYLADQVFKRLADELHIKQEETPA